MEKHHKTIINFAYEEDIDNIYAFYCSRYENISFEEFMQLGFFELKKKISSIPESEPLYKIIKARTINIGKIKNKEEKEYWNEMKRIHSIPQIFIPTKEIDIQLRNFTKENKYLGGK